MKTAKISLKKHWVSTDAWRGYEEPIFAVCGANDTGTCSDSPCRSDIASAELAMAKKELKKAGIPFKHTYGRSSNVFCAHRYLVVPADDLDIAKQIIKPLIDQTSLLYIAGH